MSARFVKRTLALFLISDDARFLNCEVVSCNADSHVRAGDLTKLDPPRRTLPHGRCSEYPIHWEHENRVD